jgi:hypothetical protein
MIYILYFILIMPTTCSIESRDGRLCLIESHEDVSTTILARLETDIKLLINKLRDLKTNMTQFERHIEQFETGITGLLEG